MANPTTTASDNPSRQPNGQPNTNRAGTNPVRQPMFGPGRQPNGQPNTTAPDNPVRKNRVGQPGRQPNGQPNFNRAGGPGPQNFIPGGPPNGRPGFARDPRTVNDLRGQRREHVERGGRRIIVEPDRRFIVRDNNRTFIRHDDSDRFRRFGTNTNIVRNGNQIRTITVRSDGMRIITVSDGNGRMLRRIRRYPNGREVILIDNSYGYRNGPGGQNFFLDMPPPRIRIPQDEYYVESDNVPPQNLVATLEAPPLQPVERAYTLDEIRYNPNLVARMRRINVNTINFDLGSWDVPQNQIGKLQAVASAISTVLKNNPNAILMVAGHTDAVGPDVDNLSLSDRRAESVAVILSQTYGIPPENLVTQGYGEQQLIERTAGPSAANRRVEIINVTPFMASQNQPGQPQSAQPVSGQPQSDQPGPDQPQSDQPQNNDPGPEQPQSGQPDSGQPDSGAPQPGQPQ